MQKDRKLINKIKGLVGLESEIELQEVVLPDGSKLYAEEYVAGEAIFIVNEDGENIPLPVGEYVMEDGKTIVVTEEGVIAEILDGEPAAEEMSAEMLEAINKTLAEMKDENTRLKSELEEAKKKKVEVKASKVKGVKASPEGLPVIMSVQKDTKAMSPKERIHAMMEKTPFYSEVKLDTTTSVTSTYAGEFAGSYIAAATMQGVTLGARAITIKENIKFKEVVKKIDTADILADATCDFTPTGSVTATERIIEPKELQVNLELCTLDWRADWEAMQMGVSAWDVMPPSFEAFFVEEIAAIVNAAIETSIYQGDASNEGEFDGFGILLAADAAVIDVDNTGVTIDATTIIDELGKIVDAIPVALWNTPDLTIYLSSNMARAYTRALGGFGAAGLGGSGYMAQGPTGEKPLNFDGVPIFVANGLKAGEAIAAQASNLWYGTGLLNDKNEVAVIDMSSLGEKNTRYVLRFTGGVQYGVGAEIVYYWTEV